MFSNTQIKSITVYVIILVLIIIISRIVAILIRPVVTDTEVKINDLDTYLNQVYKSNLPPEIIKYEKDENYKLTQNIDIKNTFQYMNFFYDVAPHKIRDEYDMSPNLSMSWPPSIGTRYKMTAFPYPKTFSVIKGIYQLISNTADSATFPGWFISRYDPFDFNNNIYNNNFFKPYQNIEVIHACYPPPGEKFPNCDDGGWWAYLSVGSGMFWNTGNCIVSKNKISLLVDLYNQTNGKLGLSVNDIVDRIKNKGGGHFIMPALFKVIDALQKDKKNTKVDILGFKNMTKSNSGYYAWNSFVTRSAIIFYLMVLMIIYYTKNLKNYKTRKSKIIFSIVSIIILISLIMFWIYVVTEHFIRGFGWLTLDMAINKSNKNLTEFVKECVTGKLKDPLCNSLAMIQTFDYDIEVYTKQAGYDSFILTTQPNKSGSWAVEIADLRNFTKDGKIQDSGMCGNLENDFITITSPNDNKKEIKIPILNTGPITHRPIYKPYYGPTFDINNPSKNKCICGGNKNSRCMSCKGFLSYDRCY